MLTVISGNNRNGYPCAINKVGDIFQRGIPPFETEGLADVGEASHKGGFPLAGLRGKMLGSVKVTASEESKTYVGVTVSMTSRESKTYANLSSPESGSTKYRQHRSSMPEVTVTSRNAINGLAFAHMVGLCADNLLNGRAKSAFVQVAGKEKGPAVSPALFSTSMISCTGESNELHHNSHLQATGNLSYSHYVAPHWAAGFESLRTKADIDRLKVRFFYVRYLRCAPIMVRRNGGASALAGFFGSSLSTPIRLATPFESGLVRLQNLTKEATTMATAYTRPEFIDTYWIIPEYETKPYGKVSFTRQDRRTFIAMFKDSRLIWSGRQPVKYLTENVICTQLQKLPVEGIAEGIEEISIPQGMVKITTPSISTITEIVTVQEVAHV